MPELPEVETIRHDLNAELVGHKIENVVINKEKMVHGITPAHLKKILTGNTITDIQRVGKLLIFHLQSGQYMLIHLKMTGQLIYKDKSHLLAGGHTMSKEEDNVVVPNKYTHVIWEFSGGRFLYFNDLRQFGYVKLVEDEELKTVVAKFGIEPLHPDFTGKKLGELLIRRPKSTIKAALLDQKLIAGIGNIYADEACHNAGVLPDRKVGSLTTAEINRLAKEVTAVLKLSIKHRGTTFNDYVDSRGQKGGFLRFLKVYGRQEKPCLTCKKGIIKKNRVAGRGTRFCTICQK